MPPVSLVVDAQTPHQSEQAALNGHRALTPLISGAVSGGAIGIAWVVGLLIYVYRRWRGHRAVRAAGLRSHRELDVPPPKPEAFIIPPDPAVILGVHAPGERVVFDDEPKKRDQTKHAKTVPLGETEKAGKRREHLRPLDTGRVVSAPQLPTTLSPPPDRETLAARLISSYEVGSSSRT
ncbi:hypothetical protein POSPLADRAFT_1052894 [Postia placenta MAD-698-R-SB12]|uniref:Uncharacterized protein n=1 Tax=Postia placenta MAD-698-R-SB12 TaxID=670580 RepID=A0A1X6NCQ8_9APHY|nr:hypothetical protein POSPLADRAFT_1052894 [Postia placenta MAD-698-R-SB12]OSX66226.1 hypothetical protein POSPLADRAFT_1052894 [Postia placenta MAD-698-R-SB12]